MEKNDGRQATCNETMVRIRILAEGENKLGDIPMMQCMWMGIEVKTRYG